MNSEEPEEPLRLPKHSLGLWELLVGGKRSLRDPGHRTLHVGCWTAKKAPRGHLGLVCQAALISSLTFMKAMLSIVLQSQTPLGSSLNIQRLCLSLLPTCYFFKRKKKKNPGPINHHSSEAETMVPPVWLPFFRSKHLFLSMSIFIQHRSMQHSEWSLEGVREGLTL